MKSITWYLEPLLIPLGKLLWRLHIAHEDRVWNKYFDAEEEVLMQKVFYGVPYEICYNFYSDSDTYCWKQYVDEDHSSRAIIFYYRSIFILKSVLNYYFITR
jgi:hypothetical protein